MHRFINRICLVTLFIFTALPSYSTPPDVFTADLHPIGQTESSLIFMLTTGSNLGSHYLWQDRWFLFEFFPEEITYSWINMGALTEAPEDFGGNSYRIPDNCSSLVSTLKDIGLSSASLFNLRNEAVSYEFRDSNLVLVSDTGTFALSRARFLDPGNLAWQGTEQEMYFLSETGDLVRNTESPVELLRFYPYESTSMALEVVHELVHGKARVLVVRMPDEIAPFDILVVFDQSEYEMGVNEIHGD